MKRAFQFLALAVIAASLLVWLNTGANRGWTKTSVAVKTVDEVTGIEGITYQKRFVPGLDFIGAAFAGAFTLAGISLFVKTNQNPKTNP